MTKPPIETPLNSIQIHQALKATLLYRIAFVIIAVVTLPSRKNLPAFMLDGYIAVAPLLVCWNLMFLIFIQPITRFLRQHLQWLILDLILSVGIIFCGGGWRNSYFVYTLTTIIIFTIFAHRKGAYVSSFIMAAISLCKNPLPKGDPIQIFEVTNWDMRLGASLFYVTAGVILSYFSTLVERLNQLSEGRVIQERKHSAMKQRLDLAFDLHDRLKSKLSAVLMIAGLLAKKTTSFDTQTAKDIQRLWQWLNYCQNELNTIVHSLKCQAPLSSCPNSCVDLYLLTKEEIRILSGMTGFSWYLEKSDNEFLVPKSMQSALCAFISEALTNSWKHSGGDEGWIKLCKNNDQIQLDIIDYGNGFALADVKRHKTSGLTSLYRRAEEVHGYFDIKTAPGKGCRCSLFFPVTSPN
jgi:signal transduction histidine kinase